MSNRNTSLSGKIAALVVVAMFVMIAAAELFVYRPANASREAEMPQNVRDFRRGLQAALDENFGSALKIWTRLAADGDSAGRYALGMLYWTGTGVAQNRSAGLHLIKEAAGEGFDEAQYRLGKIHTDGDGVEQDFAVALEWYRKAVRQGHAKAQLHLGVMYAEGLGVTQDSETAQMWISISAVLGKNEDAKAVWEHVAKELSEAQADRLISRVRVCVGSGYKECGVVGVRL